MYDFIEVLFIFYLLFVLVLKIIYDFGNLVKSFLSEIFVDYI